MRPVFLVALVWAWAAAACSVTSAFLPVTYPVRVAVDTIEVQPESPDACEMWVAWADLETLTYSVVIIGTTDASPCMQPHAAGDPFEFEGEVVGWYSTDSE